MVQQNVPAPGLASTVVPKGQPPIHALTGVRALAAGWVLLFHLQKPLIELFPSLVGLKPLFESGYLGVDLFFVLSGFILAYTYQDRLGTIDVRAYRRFLVLRLARVYPVHLAVLLLFVVAVPAGKQLDMHFASSRVYDYGELLYHVTLTHAWGVTDKLSWNIPSWSISAEWFAYLCFPVLVRPLLLVRRGGVALLLAATSLTAMLLALDFLGRSDLDLTHTGAILRVSGEFVAGMLLCRALRGEWSRVPWSVVVGLCMGGAVGVSAVFGPTRSVIFLLALLVLSLARSRGSIAHLLGSRPMRYAGAVSYSLYMTQGLVFMAGESLLPAHNYIGSTTLTKLGIVAVYFLALGALASLVYHLVENPGREFIRGLGQKKRGR